MRCRQRGIWNGETVSAWDMTTVMMLGRAGEKRLQSEDDGHESKRCMRSPRPEFDRDFDGTNVGDKKTWMERLEFG